VQGAFHALLYSRSRPPQTLPLDELARVSLSPDDLLWIDLTSADEKLLRDVLERLPLPAAFAELVLERDDSPALRNYGDAFGVRVVAVRIDDVQRVQGEPLAICAGRNIVLTTANATPEYLQRMRERQQENFDLGVLEAESFVVALLDAQLATFYDAMAVLEMRVEKLELALLSRRVTDVVDELRRLRQAASRLRRLLTSHRAVFSGLSRPDFQPASDQQVNAHFAALDSRFERALDLAEHGRELVVGTFELFAARAAMSTNRTMQALTFLTVLIGCLAVVVGVLGMNFEAPFFRSGATGFWVTVGSILAVAGGAVLLARRRGWI
jgi:magnesium transporter